MNKNMGQLDRIIRIVVAVVLAILAFAAALPSWATIVLGLLAAVLLATSVIGFCPLYALLKISTQKHS